jgi:tetratricopeptide (TPR) repeat protein
MSEGPSEPGHGEPLAESLPIEGLKVLGELGRGGMGVVYRARDLATGRDVALKVVLGPSPSVQQLARFEREGQLTACLAHPGIVGIHSAGVVRGAPYLVYELVEGAQELGEVLPTLPTSRKLEMIRDVASALGYAHAKGVVHRDVKPENILVDSAGRVRVADFGLAFDIELERITATNAILGTPLYMSPEQLASRRHLLGPPSDVWSLGVVLYEALTGEVPFDATGLLELHVMLNEGEITPVRDLAPDVHPDLEAIVFRCLQRDPSQRYPSATELADDITAHLDGHAVAASPWRRTRGSRRRGVAVALLGGVTLCVALIGGLSSSARAPATPSVGPWGPLEEGWSRAWELGNGQAPEGDTALWTEPYRVAAPLARVLSNDKRALAAAYPWGEATLDGERVEVRYTQLNAALRHVSRFPGQLLVRFSPEALKPTGVGAELEVLAPNDSGEFRFRVGDARWLRPHVACTLQRAGRGDMRHVGVWLGRDTRKRQLVVKGRSAKVSINGTNANFEVGEGSRVVFAPGAPLGERVLLNGRWIEELEAAGASPCELGDVGFWVSEDHVRVSEFTVSGRPLRPDAGAVAWAPPSVGAVARARAAFEFSPSAQDGGPMLALGSDLSSSLILELRGPRLVLRHGSETLACVDVPDQAPAGWIELERDGDHVRGRVRFGDRAHTLAVFDPRPCPAARAGFGSTAPRVTFTRVEVDEGPKNTARDAFDRRGASTESPPSWRSAAWSLLRLTTLEHSDMRWVGPSRAKAEARAQEAQRLATALREFADDAALSPGLRRDARIRAVLAAILAGDGPAAEALTRRIVDDLGRSAARDALDRSSWIGLQQYGLERLKAGWVNRTSDPAIQDAALRSHDVLIPADLMVPVRLAQAQVQMARSAPTASQSRVYLKRALEYCREAERRGQSPAAILGVTSECLLALGRYSEASEAWQQVVDTKPSWYALMQLATCRLALRDYARAIEAAVRGLSRTARSPKSGLGRVLLEAARRCATDAPGHAAVAYQTLSGVWPNPEQAKRARELAGVALESNTTPIGFDLALYVEARAGRDVIQAPGQRPTSALANAHRRLRDGDVAGARELILSTSKRSPLVAGLAILDPKLAPFAKRK